MSDWQPKHDEALAVGTRWAIIVAVTLGILHSCSGDNNNSITDCSSRNRPQHYDPSSGRWTCDERGQR